MVRSGRRRSDWADKCLMGSKSRLFGPGLKELHAVFPKFFLHGGIFSPADRDTLAVFQNCPVGPPEVRLGYARHLA